MITKRKNRPTRIPCPFCNHYCRVYSEKSYRCNRCDVNFTKDPDTTAFWDHIPDHFSEGKSYTLRIKFTEGITELTRNYEPRPGYIAYKVILTVPYALQNVTPQNLRDKIKTLLLFS